MEELQLDLNELDLPIRSPFNLLERKTQENNHHKNAQTVRNGKRYLLYEKSIEKKKHNLYLVKQNGSPFCVLTQNSWFYGRQFQAMLFYVFMPTNTYKRKEQLNEKPRRALLDKSYKNLFF